jgi:hypothetical protein
MNPDMCETRPAAGPDEIEWMFPNGQPAIVVHVPNEYGDYEAIRLDHVAPENLYRREMVRALLRIAERVMADSEPSVLNSLLSQSSAVTR